MISTSRPRLVAASLALMICVSSAHAIDTYAIVATPSATSSTPVTVAVTVESSPGVIDSTYNGTVTISNTDSLATNPSVPNPVAINTGKGSFQLVFFSSGAQTLTLTDVKGALAKGQVTINVISISNAALAGCGSCYATIGAGAVISHQYADYNDNSNVLQTTHVGDSTPQYLIGVAYKLPFHELFGAYQSKSLDCHVVDFSSPGSDAKAAFCYPWKAFVNFKFTPDASQTFNGFTYGLSHAIHKDLDLLMGVSYSAYNETSPGFQAAAINTLTTQLAAKNPCYSQSTLNAISNPPTKFAATVAYDGFPTQLLTNSGTASTPVCTPGVQIFAGSPLVTHYHTGFFIGVAIPLSFKGAFQ